MDNGSAKKTKLLKKNLRSMILQVQPIANNSRFHVWIRKVVHTHTHTDTDTDTHKYIHKYISYLRSAASHSDLSFKG